MRTMTSKKDLETCPNKVIRMANKIIRDPNSTRAERIVAYTALNLLKKQDTQQKA